MSRLSIRLAVCLIVAFISALLATSTPVFAEGPNFANVTDILAGRRTLFPVDDLIVSTSPHNAPLTNAIAQTENGDIGTKIYYDIPSGENEFASGIGRMFDSPRDVVVTLGTNLVTLRDQDPNGALTKEFPLNVNGTPRQNQLAKADFTGDGYTDFSYLVGSNLYILTANDVTDRSAGLFFSQAGVAPVDLTGQLVALAAGDFDGDGKPEVALAAASFKQITVTIYQVDVTKNQGQVQNINLTASGSGSFDAPEDVLNLQMVAGIYGDQVNPQTALPLADLVVLYRYNKGKHWADLTSLNVQLASTDPTLFSVAAAHTLNWVESDHDLSYLAMVTGPLSFFGTTDQIVATAQEPGNYSHLGVFTTDPALKLTRANEQIHQENFSNVVSVVLGNFDQDQDAQDPIQLEVGVLRYTTDLFGVETQAELLLYHVAAGPQYELTHYKSGHVGSKFPATLLTYAVNLSAGDTQGRSLFLGAPTMVTASNQQATMVLGMPPQHIDYITPFQADGPQVLNVSAVPQSFNSVYQTTGTSSTKSSHQATTSYGTSFSESTSQKFSYGVPDVDSVSVALKMSATQKWNNSTSKTYDNFSVFKFSSSTATGTDDQIWVDAQDQTFYVYPVIGRKTCPQSSPPDPNPPIPLCAPNEEVPLNLTLAGPTVISQDSTQGAATEWYQPVTEPYNVLSYPWDLEQLKVLEPNMHLLTSNQPTTFFTDGSGLSEQAEWSSGNGNSVTVGAEHNYSWNVSVSISDDVEIPEAGGLGASNAAKFSYGGSVSLSTMKSSETSLSSSTGIGINKPNTFPDPLQYSYAIAPFIFGSHDPTGTIHHLDLGTDIQTSGVMRSVFTADPTNQEAGTWWAGAYNVPDVALNHPGRWSVQENTSGDTGGNCLPIGSGTSSANCATFMTPDPDVWSSQWHWMKGLFITSGEANGQGPQISSIRAGKEALIQARVYNYSLVDMPAGTETVIQFYGQPFDERTHQPTADAFLVDQVTLEPIPGFNTHDSPDDLPNWEMANTGKLDTAAYSGQFLAFWVVAWAQDTNGNLVADLPAHGLTSKPGVLTDISQATALAEPYSNNVGFFKSLFYIVPADAPLTSASRTDLRLTMDPVHLSKKSALLNQPVIISTRVRSDTEHGRAAVLFFDGKPGKVPFAFEYEGIPHIRAGAAHEVRAIFRPTSCGTHNIFLKLTPAGSLSNTTLEVTINAKKAVGKLQKALKKLNLGTGRGGGGLAELLQEAKQAFKNKNNKAGLDALEKFQVRVKNLRGNKIPEPQADLMLGMLKQIFACVK